MLNCRTMQLAATSLWLAAAAGSHADTLWITNPDMPTNLGLIDLTIQGKVRDAQ